MGHPTTTAICVGESWFQRWNTTTEKSPSAGAACSIGNSASKFQLLSTAQPSAALPQGWVGFGPSHGGPYQYPFQHRHCQVSGAEGARGLGRSKRGADTPRPKTQPRGGGWKCPSRPQRQQGNGLHRGVLQNARCSHTAKAQHGAKYMQVGVCSQWNHLRPIL